MKYFLFILYLNIFSCTKYDNLTITDDKYSEKKLVGFQLGADTSKKIAGSFSKKDVVYDTILDNKGNIFISSMTRSAVACQAK